jgi:uncharacterized ParB-like nuclease family protein
MTTATATRYQVKATDPQISAIARMRGRKMINARGADLLAQWDMAAALGELQSKGLASQIMDYLMAAGWAPRDNAPAADAAPLEAGMYRDDKGNVYRVQPAKESRRLYAKLLVVSVVTTEEIDESGEWADVPVLGEAGELTYRASFEYAAGAIHRLTAAMRMTQEQARAMGHEFSICCVCATVLEDPKSIAAGIGPVCAKRV